MNAALRESPVGGRFKLLYGAGSLIDGIINTALNYFLLFYLTSVCGFSGTAAGAALLIGLLLDAVADPAIGLFTDHTRSRFGRRLPFIAISTPLLAVSFGLIFSTPLSLSEPVRLAYAILCGLGLRIALSFYLLPYVSVGAEVTEDYRERSSIVSYRISFVMIGGIAAIALGLGVFMTGPDGLTDPRAYAGFGWAGAAIIALAGLCAAIATKGALPRLHAPSADEERGLRVFLADFRDIFRNRSFLILFIATLAYCVGQGMGAAMTIHLNRYFWKLSTDQVQWVMLAMTIGPIIGAPLTALLSRWFEKKPLAIAGFMIFVFAQVWPPVAQLGGLMPADRSVLFTILLANAFLLGIGFVMGAICAQSMMADAADKHEYLFGVRREALFFAGLGLAFKAASGLGGFLAGIALDIIRFPVAEATSAKGAVLSSGLLTNLAVVAGIIPALITLLAPSALFAYSLSRQRHHDLLETLKQRRLDAAR